MARGWESKSVENQMEDRDRTPIPAGNQRPGAEQDRALGLLELTRKRLLLEIESASTPRFRELKRRTLAHVDAEIAALCARPNEAAR